MFIESEKHHQLKEVVLIQLIKYAYKNNKKDTFTLASGEKSNLYIDCKQITMRGEIMPFIAKLLHKIIILYDCQFKLDAIGGVTMGADPIAAAYAYHNCVNMFSVRKEATDHGVNRIFVGPSLRGKNVIIVEDVVTTGGSTMHAINCCLHQQMNILGIIPFVDRQKHDYKSLWRKYLPKESFIMPVFTLEEIQTAWEKQQLN